MTKYFVMGGAQVLFFLFFFCDAFTKKHFYFAKHPTFSTTQHWFENKQNEEAKKKNNNFFIFSKRKRQSDKCNNKRSGERGLSTARVIRTLRVQTARVCAFITVVLERRCAAGLFVVRACVLVALVARPAAAKVECSALAGHKRVDRLARVVAIKVETLLERRLVAARFAIDALAYTNGRHELDKREDQTKCKRENHNFCIVFCFFFFSK